MDPLKDLKQIANNQKTVRTSRLRSLLSDVEEMYLKTAKRVNNQQKEIGKLKKELYEVRRKKKNGAS